MGRMWSAPSATPSGVRARPGASIDVICAEAPGVGLNGGGKPSSRGVKGREPVGSRVHTLPLPCGPSHGPCRGRQREDGGIPTPPRCHCCAPVGRAKGGGQGLPELHRRCHGAGGRRRRPMALQTGPPLPVSLFEVVGVSHCKSYVLCSIKRCSFLLGFSQQEPWLFPRHPL